jgi:hypothetical protein
VSLIRTSESTCQNVKPAPQAWEGDEVFAKPGLLGKRHLAESRWWMYIVCIFSVSFAELRIEKTGMLGDELVSVL